VHVVLALLVLDHGLLLRRVTSPRCVRLDLQLLGKLGIGQADVLGHVRHGRRLLVLVAEHARLERGRNVPCGDTTASSAAEGTLAWMAPVASSTTYVNPSLATSSQRPSPGDTVAILTCGSLSEPSPASTEGVASCGHDTRS